MINSEARAGLLAASSHPSARAWKTLDTKLQKVSRNFLADLAKLTSVSKAANATLGQLNPHGPVDEYVGSWPHTRALRARFDLPRMLAGLGLLPETFGVERLGAEHRALPGTGCASQ